MVKPSAWFLATSLLVASACGGSSGTDGGADVDSSGPADAAPDADTGAVPRIEPASCRFEVDASLGLTEGSDYDCGDLIVSENRAAPVGNIRLHYIRFASSAASDNATIYLDGGPGGSGQGIVGYLAYLGQAFVDALLVDGDFLVIGQRGTALSIPYLECFESDCQDYADSAHIPSYNTAYNADDVDDLRAALGYDRLNVYGISYGSRLGLEVLRRHGDRVRAAVIDGLVPSQIVWPAEIPASFYSSLTGLDASCADHGACAAAFGNLVTDFTTAVGALNDNPVTISFQGNDTELDGYSFAYLLFQVLYSKSTFPMLPMVISDLAIRRTDRIDDFLGELLSWTGGDRGISMGLYYTVVCGELFNPPDPDAFDDANAAVPPMIRDLFSGSWYGLLDTCATWPVGDLQAALAVPVTSSVPTLVTSGRLDPITPPRFGDIAAAGLDASTVAIYENSGHGATVQSNCALDNFLGFFADPATPPDTSCAAAVTTDYVLPSSVTAPVLPAARIRAELGRAPVPPHLRRWFEARRR